MYSLPDWSSPNEVIFRSESRSKTGPSINVHQGIFVGSLCHLSLGLLNPIADAPLGEDVGGVVRVVAELSAQSLHDGAYRA